MVYVIYSFCSLAPLKWTPECFLVIFFCRPRVNYFLFKISLNRKCSGVITGFLSCLAEYLCNWFCKCFSISVYIPLDYSGKGTKSFDTLTGDQELEVRMATYGPEIDQSQRAKSVGCPCTNVYNCSFPRITPTKI